MSANLRNSAIDAENIVSIDIIIDQLYDFDIVWRPRNTHRKLKWCVTPNPALFDTSLTLPFKPEDTLLLLHTENVDEYLSHGDKSVGLLVLQKDEPFSAATPPFDRDYLRRLLIVRERAGHVSFLSLQSVLQSVFFLAQNWADRCQQIVLSNGSFQDLVDASRSVFDNWIDITDATYNLIAYTTDIVPPDEMSRNLVKHGCHTSALVEQGEELGVFREWREQKMTQTFHADKLVPYDYLTSIMRVGDEYCGHVVMVCNNSALTPGLVDAFTSFSQYCVDLMKRKATANRETPVPYRDFLIRLLENDHMGEDYVHNQMRIIGMGDANYFMLVIVRSDEGSYSEQPRLLRESLANSYPDSKIIRYEGRFLMLFSDVHRTDDTAMFDYQAAADFCARYECTIYISQPFSKLSDLKTVYEQTKLIERYRPSIDVGRAFWGATDAARDRVYLFADSFIFRRTDFSVYHDALHHLDYANTPLDAMIETEPNRDVSDLKLLYTYLVNERKATPTADQLHMHRNNVIYRIKSIEKRYRIDLNDFSIRQYLLACYHMKINGSVRFRDLLK